MVGRPAVFLDRDGVLSANVTRDGRLVAPTSVDQFQLLPGVPEGVSRLKIAGFVTVVVTNQPDIATGRSSWGLVESMHAVLRRRVAVDDIRVCPHVDADNCECRKPKPGLLVAAAADHRLALSDSYLIGDRWRDVAAGRAVGCTTILLQPGDDVAQEAFPPGCVPDFVVTSFPEAVDLILARTFHRGVAAAAARTV